MSKKIGCGMCKDCVGKRCKRWPAAMAAAEDHPRGEGKKDARG